MKKVFVTGISGLLGANLVHLLTDQGYLVKGLIRDKSKFEGEHNPNLQLIVGGLFDDFSKVLNDVDYVVHIAAVTCQKMIDFSDYWQVNTNATIQLFHSAARCNVMKFIFVSTANTLEHGSLENPGTELEAVKAPFKDSLYARSKKMAEDFLLGYNGKMEIVIVNPTFIIGAFDTKPSSGRLILMCWRKKLAFYPPGGKNFVHAQDVANGIIKCIENGKNGEKYILAGENLSFRDFFQRVIAITNQKTILISLPVNSLKLIGIFGDLCRKLRIKTSISTVNMRILCTKSYYSNKKSLIELGMKYQPIDHAIADAIHYFEHKN